MKRYDLVYNEHINGGGIGELQNGKYVTFDEAQAQIEVLIEALEGAANMLQGMMMDASICPQAKSAMERKIKDIDAVLETE